MELEADKDFLMAVVNEAVLHQRTDFPIRSVLLDIDLMRVDLAGNRIGSIARREDFDAVVPRIRLKLGNEALRSDLPDHSDFREILQSSILLPENIGELFAEMKDIEERKSDPYKNPRQKCLGIDTNVAYRRLLSRLLAYGGPLRPRDMNFRCVQILLPSIVEQEISARVGRKYTGRDIDELSDALGKHGLIRGFLNCCYKDGRKALNAQSELRILKEKFNCWDVMGGNFIEDKEKRDVEIVRALADHASSQNLDLVYLTADDKSLAHAVAYKMCSIGLRYPREIPGRTEVDPWLLIELLYDISVVFGAISLRGLGVTIMGDWSGKTTEDYHRERVKLVIEENSALKSVLEKDRRILARLESTVDLRRIA
ncbi:MAG: hypothetical protein FJ151_00385 [Euryarchaeota archaeon]|nr:hypothetical protein [Euryarchaeota archaeon]